MQLPIIDPRMAAFALSSFISIMAIINPLSTIGLFISLTKNDKEEEKHKIAFRASLVALLVLVFFALTGFFIFQIYSITVDAFRIAGGAVLLIIGMRMLYPREPEDGKLPSGGLVYVVPLAIPMTSGPGAITTVVVLSSQANNPWLVIALWVAIIVSCAINFIVLRFAPAIERKVGPVAVAAAIKIMGLLVCSVGVQFIINGLKGAFPLLATGA